MLCTSSESSPEGSCSAPASREASAGSNLVTGWGSPFSPARGRPIREESEESLQKPPRRQRVLGARNTSATDHTEHIRGTRRLPYQRRCWPRTRLHRHRFANLNASRRSTILKASSLRSYLSPRPCNASCNPQSLLYASPSMDGHRVYFRPAYNLRSISACLRPNLGARLLQDMQSGSRRGPWSPKNAPATNRDVDSVVLFPESSSRPCDTPPSPRAGSRFRANPDSRRTNLGHQCLRLVPPIRPYQQGG